MLMQVGTAIARQVGGAEGPVYTNTRMVGSTKSHWLFEELRI